MGICPRRIVEGLRKLQLLRRCEKTQPPAYKVANPHFPVQLSQERLLLPHRPYQAATFLALRIEVTLHKTVLAALALWGLTQPSCVHEDRAVSDQLQTQVEGQCFWKLDVVINLEEKVEMSANMTGC